MSTYKLQKRLPAFALLVVFLLPILACAPSAMAPMASDGGDSYSEELASDDASDEEGDAMAESVAVQEIDRSDTSLRAVTNQSAPEQPQVNIAREEVVLLDSSSSTIVADQSNQVQSQQTILPPPTATPAPLATQTVKGTPDAMNFEDYGVNPFIDTEDDNLSTFAIDVDTGSYTIARRYVTDGLLPPQEAVRVEEFVNYFDYDYALPSQDEVFAIHIDAAPFPFAQAQGDAQGEDGRYRMLRIGIQGYEIAPEDRQDVALTFVIDVSGSMEREDRLTLVKRALTMLVEELRPTDSVSIVVYGSNARIVLYPTPASDKNSISNAIFALRTEGSTNAEAGLRLAYDLAWNNFNPQAVNRVILASDGVANVGATGPGSIWEQIEQYAGRGITLTSVGFGMGNYNDVLMEQLADMGDGIYAYVDDIEEARRLFVEDLTGTLQAIAMDAKIQVEFNAHIVSRYRLVGYENRDVADEDFRNDDVDAGEIGAGHSVTALYEIKLQADDQGDPVEGTIATVYLRWQDPETAEISEINRPFNTEEIAPSFVDALPDFQLAVVVAEYAEILRGSFWTEDETITDRLMAEVARIGDLLTVDEKANEFVDLVWQAERLARR